jgi:hypothetical protein
VGFFGVLHGFSQFMVAFSIASLEGGCRPPDMSGTHTVGIEVGVTRWAVSVVEMNVGRTDRRVLLTEPRAL